MNHNQRHKYMGHFFISKYFHNCIMKYEFQQETPQLNKSSINNQIDFYNIRNISKLNLSSQCLNNMFKILKSKYQNNFRAKTILINIIKDSAKLENFEQISGNAMLLLNEIDPIQRKQDFSRIRLKNSKISNMVFQECNFINSQFDNVDISSTSFVKCQLENVKWKNIPSSFDQIFYPQHPSVGSAIILLNKGILALQSQKQIELLNIKNGKSLFVMHDDQYQGNVHISQNGILLVSFKIIEGQFKKKICFWNTLIQKKIRVFLSQNFYSRAFAIPPDFRYFGQQDQKYIQLQSLIDGKFINQFKCKNSRISSMVFLYDGSILASYEDYDTIYLYNTITGEIIQQISYQQSPYNKVFLYFDNSFLVLMSSNFEEPTIETNYFSFRINYFVTWQVIPQNTNLPLTATNCSKRYFKLKEGMKICKSNSILVFGKPPDHQFVLNKNYNQIILSKLIDLYQLPDSYQTQISLEENFKCVAIENKNKILATSRPSEIESWQSRKNNTILLWNIVKRINFKTLIGHYDEVLIMSFSPNSSILASGSKDKTIILWYKQQKWLPKVLQGHKAEVTVVLFSSDGKLLASASSYKDKKIILWNTYFGSMIHIINGEYNEVPSVAFSKTGNLIACGSDDGIIRFWNTQTGEMVKYLKKSNQKVYSLSFQDNDQVIKVQCNTQIYSFNINSGENIKTIQVPENMKISPDGKIGTAHDEYYITFLDTNEICRFGRGKIDPSSIVFSPNSQIIAANNQFNRRMSFWKIGQNQRKYDNQCHQDASTRASKKFQTIQCNMTEASITSNYGSDLLNKFIREKIRR